MVRLTALRKSLSMRLLWLSRHKLVVVHDSVNVVEDALVACRITREVRDRQLAALEHLGVLELVAELVDHDLAGCLNAVLDIRALLLAFLRDHEDRFW